MSAIQPSDAKRRRDRIKLLLGQMVDTKEKVLTLITEAKENDDHLSLGFQSWTEYVSAEYADALADLNREDRRFAAFALTQTGMSTRAVAPILGVSKSSVDRARLSHRGTVERPATVTSLDGRERPASQPSGQKPRRKPLPDAFWDATHDLSKLATRLENLHKDDRFNGNREAVLRNKADLVRAYFIVGRIIKALGGADPDQGRLS